MVRKWPRWQDWFGSDSETWFLKGLVATLGAALGFVAGVYWAGGLLVAGMILCFVMAWRTRHKTD